MYVRWIELVQGQSPGGPMYQQKSVRYGLNSLHAVPLHYPVFYQMWLIDYGTAGRDQVLLLRPRGSWQDRSHGNPGLMPKDIRHKMMVMVWNYILLEIFTWIFKFSLCTDIARCWFLIFVHLQPDLFTVLDFLFNESTGKQNLINLQIINVSP